MPTAKKPTTPVPLDFDAILAGATRREGTVRLCLAGAVLAELEELEAALDRAKEDTAPSPSLAGPGRSPQAAALEEQIASTRQRMRDAEVPFRFRALGDSAWSELLAAHPPAEKGHLFNPAGFAPAAIAACSVAPEMTADQVTQLYEVINQGQQTELWDKVWEINTEAVAIPFSLRGSGILDSLTAGK